MFMHIFITCMILTSCFVHLAWFELFILWHVFFTFCWFGMHATQFVITLTIIIKLIKTLRVSLMLSGRRIHLQCRRQGFNSWVRKIPWGRKWQPAPVFFRRKSHGQRDLLGCSPWGCKSQTQPSDYWPHSTIKTLNLYFINGKVKNERIWFSFHSNYSFYILKCENWRIW